MGKDFGWRRKKGNAQNSFFKLFTLISTVTPTLESNFKIERIIMMLIAGLSIYFLMLELKIKPKYAILSSLVYLFNAFPIRRFLSVTDEFLSSYIWIPLFFLFLIKFLDFLFLS